MILDEGSAWKRITFREICIDVKSLMSEISSADGMLQRKRYEDLLGWNDDNHAQALATFVRSCQEIVSTGHGFKRAARYGGTRSQWFEICELAAISSEPRQFFQSQFVPFEVVSNEELPPLITGYFEPVASGSLEESEEYSVPIYSRPPELVAFDETDQRKLGLSYGRIESGSALPYFSRQEIESGALANRGMEIVWLNSWEDAFFIHIQGSGRVRLNDGGELRLAYAAKSGLPYTGIGSVLIERGVLTKETSSMQSIRAWMRMHPEESRNLMWQNKSFVFFRKIEVSDASLGALGAQQVNLTPGRSLAIDRSVWMFGTPVWIDTSLPPESPQGPRSLKRLMIAQDTGSAIKGAARGDIYWGWGSEAEKIAGHMKSRARVTVLLPRSVAGSLGLMK